MNVLIIGSGGREHAIAYYLSKSPAIQKLYCAPGNGGIAECAALVPIKATDIEAIVQWASANSIDFAVPAMDDPLVMGIVDALEAVGIPCFGPDKKAAAIEGSKVFSKNLMKKYGIPTAAYEVFDNAAQAKAYLRAFYAKSGKGAGIVLKADGLAAGKGVLIAQSEAEALAAVTEIMEDKKFGASGNQLVIEEFLTGPEVSVLTFTDGKTIVPMVSSMDHKRAMDNDQGLNTGGMGTVAPNPYYTDSIAERCMREIFLPTIQAMVKEDRPFKGCLYFGLMLTPDGPKVIEYNCRFGDPETQVVLPLLETDLFEIFRAVREERLAELEIRNKAGCAVCVILASGGYPGKYPTGLPIAIGDTGGALLFHAGTKRAADGTLLTAGGRVLGVTSVCPTLPEAISTAYASAEQVTFEGVHKRTDIGQRALAALI
ncbi:MAG: phosphoribosylamine--glycine ligase [Oscillospiraceae bacterium]|jgi:phosphoribosylamine--glycine ligase|nr:phosphoribosylamine--glycine ligase [Oscillospiraceae bacterium]